MSPLEYSAMLKLQSQERDDPAETIKAAAAASAQQHQKPNRSFEKRDYSR